MHAIRIHMIMPMVRNLFVDIHESEPGEYKTEEMNALKRLSDETG